MPVPALPHLPSYRDFDRNGSTASRRLPPPLPRPHTEQVVERAGLWCSGLGRFSGLTRGARGVGWSSVCVRVEQRENGATPTGEPLTWNRARGGGCRGTGQPGPSFPEPAGEVGDKDAGCADFGAVGSSSLRSRGELLGRDGGGGAPGVSCRQRTGAPRSAVCR